MRSQEAEKTIKDRVAKRQFLELMWHFVTAAIALPWHMQHSGRSQQRALATRRGNGSSEEHAACPVEYEAIIEAQSFWQRQKIWKEQLCHIAMVAVLLLFDGSIAHLILDQGRWRVITPETRNPACDGTRRRRSAKDAPATTRPQAGLQQMPYLSVLFRAFKAAASPS